METTDLPDMHVRRTILLTGFGPFPGVPVNATSMLVPHVEQTARDLFPSHDVISEVLPVEWEGAPARIKSHIARGNVALVLHLGVSQDARGFQLELVGRNLRTSLEDGAGRLPESSRVVATGPELLATTLPAERIAARLMSLGYPCETSDNAGAYVCNALLYHSLAAARESPAPYLAGFVHVPKALIGHGPDGLQAHPDSPLDWKRAVAGTLEIIATCLDHLAEQERR